MDSYKPPNVLVLCNSKSDEDVLAFETVKSELQLCLGIERYVVYPLSDLGQPWKENCSLLVLPSTFHITEDKWKEISSYLQSGGKCLSTNAEMNGIFVRDFRKFTDDDADGGIVQIANNATTTSFYTISLKGNSFTAPSVTNYSTVTTDIVSNTSACIKMVSSETYNFAVVCSSVHLFHPQGYLPNMDLEMVKKIKESTEARHGFIRSILSSLGLHLDTERNIPELSYVYSATQNNELVNDLISKLHKYSGDTDQSSILVSGEGSSSLFVIDDFNQGTPVDPSPPTTNEQVTILLKPSQQQIESLYFNTDMYFKCLKTTSLGRLLFIGPVMTSSQTLFSLNIPMTRLLENKLGVVCTPGQQTKGKGRGGNVWISPKGCMMFSCPLQFPVTSQLSKKASIVQHIVALSVVAAIRTKPGYEDVPFNIKWPNDIYYKKLVKLGGVLVTSYTLDKITTLIIGCGVNVNNHYPTLSVNDCIAMYNSETGTKLPALNLEELLALTLSNLEMYTSLYNQYGITAIESLYYQYWMHKGDTVQLSGHQNIEATILGIDEYGYLRVVTAANQFLTLHPDGNTFDIMKGLISMKS